MIFFIQTLIDAISLGGLYALMALGLAMVFSIMGLVNWAHGEILMISGYTMFFLAGQSPFLVVFGTLAVSVVLALGMERVAFRPLRGAEPTSLMIASFALSYFLQNLALATMGGFAKSLNALPYLIMPVAIFDLQVSMGSIITIFVTAAVLILLTIFLRRTSLGVQMRAAAEDIVTAQLLGVKTNKVVASAFSISGLLAGIVSLLFIGQLGLVGHTVGIEPLIVAFVGIVLGGMGRLSGAALGGFMVGILQTSFQASLPPTLGGYRQAFVFAVVLFFLLFRPQGILPRRSVGRRA